MQGCFSPVQPPATPWTLAHQPPLSMMGLSRQEYWSGFHSLLQGIFPTQGSNKHLLCLPQGLAGSLPLESSGKPWQRLTFSFFGAGLFNKLAVFNYTCKKNQFCTFKGKKNHLNQFSPESKQHHGHPVSNKLSFLSIVTALWLQYRLNSTQIDCDSRDRRTDKNLRTSLQGDGGV